jgi:hypothetical protein
MYAWFSSWECILGDPENERENSRFVAPKRLGVLRTDAASNCLGVGRDTPII